MKVFITGATGFLGKHLLERVRANTYLFSKGEDPAVLEKYQPDYVYHLAAEIYEEKEMIDSNIILTHKLLESARKVENLKAFIHIGSSSEYGRKKHPMSETDYLDPFTLYESTKGAASLLCQTYARSYGLPVMVARPFSLYGKYEPERRFIPTIIRKIRTGEELSIAPGVHDFIHVDDFISGLLLLANKPTPGEIYNFGTGIQTSNEELVLKLEYLLKKTAVKTFIPIIHAYDSDNWVCDNSKARKLGWIPKYSLTEGLTKVIKEKL